MSRKAVASFVAAALVLAGVTLFLFSRAQQTPEQAATAYLSAWQQSDYPAMQQILFRKVANFREVHENAFKDLGASMLSLKLGTVTRDGPSAKAAFSVTWALKAAGDWTYSSSLDLEKVDRKWLVVWTPATIHPALAETGTGFKRTRTWPERGKILAADGKPITDERRVVVVGIQPNRVKDRPALIQALVANLGADPAQINKALDQPGLRGDWFLPVQQLPADRYDAVKPILYPIPGVVFQSKQQRLPPSPGFAQHVIGTTGPITKELLTKLGEPYDATDQVGLTGLEAVYEKTLAGTPTIQITTAGDKPKLLHRVDGQPGKPVKTTLLLDVQTAAENALAGVDKPAAIVVVDIATSEMRAVVSRPLDQFNRAMSGRYPPGSSFKIVTSAGLMSAGVPLQQKVTCPKEIKVGGRTFGNFEGEELGQLTFRDAFVHSCNTAFIGLVSAANQPQLTQAASNFGFGRNYQLPLNAAGGSYPDPKDATERAAEAIGQGRVLVSPMHMATVAAAAASSGWKPPQLLADQPIPAPVAIDSVIGQNLRAMMLAVVAEGTGVQARIPGREMAGKTGTAEFGRDNPPKTHAWFVGYSGQLAFAILVEGGGVGGEVAAPIAAKLVTGL